jgi:hypothetical protein
MISEKDAELSAEEIDCLIRTGIGAKFHGTVTEPIIHILYSSARSKLGGKPLTFLSARQLMERVKPKETVLFLTGWTIRNWMEGETDGPPGCAALARALSLGLGAVPIVVTEEKLVDMIAGAFRGAGLHRSSVSEAKKIPNRFAVIGLPVGTNVDEALRISREILNELSPVALISVEKAGPNEQGVYHSGRGEDITGINARTEYLIEESRKRGILTIGIGDLGNEIGMGLIKDTIQKVVPYGARCNCPCGSGLACSTVTDIVVPAFISNWGAYGIAACLALLLDQLEVMHDGETEDCILTECVRNNAICAPMGLSSLSPAAVDQVPRKYNRYIVELLYYMVSSRLLTVKSKEKFRKDIATTSSDSSKT